MHEQSIANSLVDVVMEHLIESGATRVRRIVVEVGELSGVVPAALQSAFKLMADREPGIGGAALEIHQVAVTLYCEDCKSERPAVSIQAMRCKVCDRASGQIVRGRELEVIAIEVDGAATHA